MNVEPELWEYKFGDYWRPVSSDEPWRSKGMPVRPLYTAAQLAAELPDREPETNDTVEGEVTTDGIYGVGWRDGWNACLDAVNAALEAKDQHA